MKKENTTLRVFHGTDIDSARNIITGGIKIQNTGGYFGNAFYITDDPLLAKHNYAGSGGCVLEFDLKLTPTILDLRLPEHSDKWYQFSKALNLFESNIHNLCKKNKIDGLWDNAIGGWAIYNTSSLQIAGNILQLFPDEKPKLPKEAFVSGVFQDPYGIAKAEPGSMFAVSNSGQEKLHSQKFGIERWDSQYSSRYLVRGDTGEIIGSLKVARLGKPHGNILTTIWVDQDHRGHGIAQQMTSLATLEYRNLTLDKHLTIDGAKFFGVAHAAISPSI